MRRLSVLAFFLFFHNYIAKPPPFSATQPSVDVFILTLVYVGAKQRYSPQSDDEEYVPMLSRAWQTHGGGLLGADDLILYAVDDWARVT